MEEKSIQQADFERKAGCESTQIYKGKTISVRTDQFKDPSGKLKKYEVVEHPGAVVGIPVNERGEIILVKQWRRAAKEILLELPAGTLEPRESPLECLDRELQEEIGYKAKDIVPLGGFFSAPGFCNEYLHLFLARELTKSVLEADDDEAIDVVFVSLEKALELIDQNLISDAKTIAGILRYKQWQSINTK